MGEILLPLNSSKEVEFQVTKEFTAVHIGSGNVSVLATPSMILFMEIACGMLAHELIPTGYTTVGTHVCIDHISAVLEGEKVVSRTRVDKQENRKIVFAVEVLHGDKVIGNGVHERFIVNEQRFLEKLQS
ncbi:MAG: thioesterase family protein [Candidatus Kariarchaeaceae archaeon]